MRANPALLLLIGLVVAVTTMLTSAVAPLTERTSDRAIADTVRDAGSRGAVVATFPNEADFYDARRRDPRAVAKLRKDATQARSQLPARLAAVVRPGVSSLTTPALHLLDAGPGRYLRLTYLDTPDGAPAVTYTAGAAPAGSTAADQDAGESTGPAPPWPVQVALSQASAAALGVGPGARLPAEDEQHRPVDVRVSGVFLATEPDDEAWLTTPELLRPTQGVSDGLERTSAAALVSAESMPDLLVAVPLDDVTQRVTFNPQPDQLRWQQAPALAQAVVSLKASPGLARGNVSWDSLLDRVLDEGLAQVTTARGQARVLIVGLVAGALLVLVLAAQLLVRRRAGSVALARERGASLLGIGAELFVEALGVAATGAAIGLLATWLLVGDAGWRAAVPVLVVASLAGPVLGALLAARSTDTRRVPANRTARRTAARALKLRRFLVESTLVAAAVLSFVALHQRGVLGGGDDLTASSAPTWWAVAGSLVVLRALPPLTRWVLAGARGSTAGVRFFAAARVAQTGARALPLLVVTVTVAQLGFGIALVATEQEGQSAGALLAVGGDARLQTTPARSVEETAGDVAAAPGVRAAVAGRVADGVRASSRTSAATVRLVVVDAAAYERLLAASPLPDAPQLARLRTSEGDRVPALLLGGDPDLRDQLVVRWQDDAPVPLVVVGVAPLVGASPDPVIVVDSRAFAAEGAGAEPDTVWAVGPGAAAAVTAAAGSDGSVEVLADVLDARRDAPLASGLVHLAVASSALLLLLAVLGVVLASAGAAPARAESLGRLRSLGLSDGELRRVLAGELLAPVVVGALAGLALGVGCALATFGSLSLEQVTGQSATPQLVVPWWTLLTLTALVGTVVVITQLEWSRLRRTSLAQLLREGDRR